MVTLVFTSGVPHEPTIIELNFCRLVCNVFYGWFYKRGKNGLFAFSGPLNILLPLLTVTENYIQKKVLFQKGQRAFKQDKH